MDATFRDAAGREIDSATAWSSGPLGREAEKRFVITSEALSRAKTAELEVTPRFEPAPHAHDEEVDD